jgi:hypothetical protein
MANRETRREVKTHQAFRYALDPTQDLRETRTENGSVLKKVSLLLVEERRLAQLVGFGR